MYKANFVEMRFSFVYRIGDRASFEQPRQYPIEISHVLMDGVSVLTGGMQWLHCRVLRYALPARPR